MRRLITLMLGTLGLLACGTNPSTAVRYDGHTAGAANEPRTRIDIEDRVADECGLPFGSTYFAYDSADLDRADDNILARVAVCMQHGALRHASVVVIGYTDARGTSAYNAGLGMTRAEAVADALVSRGVAKDRLFVKSYGEIQASDTLATDDQARDRKVTLRVADPIE